MTRQQRRAKARSQAKAARHRRKTAAVAAVIDAAKASRPGRRPPVQVIGFTSHARTARRAPT